MARARDSPSGGTWASFFPLRSISFCHVRRSQRSLNTLRSGARTCSVREAVSVRGSLRVYLHAHPSVDSFVPAYERQTLCIRL